MLKFISVNFEIIGGILVAILDIKKAGELVLKQQAQPIERIDKTIRTLLDDMAETMYKANSVGLAAPQVGQSIQVVVIDIGEGLLELINPTIIRKEGTEIDTEGCLSVPGYFGDVERFEKVTVKGIDPHNKKVMIKAEGFLARIFQHEIDHLEGHLFIEKATNLRRIADHPEEKEIV